MVGVASQTIFLIELVRIVSVVRVVRDGDFATCLLVPDFEFVDCDLASVQLLHDLRLHQAFLVNVTRLVGRTFKLGRRVVAA